ncbi:hypothetical protein K502DRAFT_345116 [Neoconidiobolus thromboides FSU 785]|nr:hypothetical protein K502DRAFT_345116 [Neoconidiobolus thromboides FSU 785]
MFKKSACLLLLRLKKEAKKFEILMVKRSNVGSFKSAYVFPGGGIEKVDSLISWYDLDLGLQLKKDDLTTDFLPYELAAVRETFEETGILCTETKDTFIDTKAYEIERKKVLANSLYFYDLIKTQALGKLNLTNLKFIASWLTPKHYPKRFLTNYYLSILTSHSIPPTSDNLEIQETRWVDIKELIDSYENDNKNKILLFPPQYYLLCELNKFSYEGIIDWYQKFPNHHDYLLRDSNNPDFTTTPWVSCYCPLRVGSEQIGKDRREMMSLSGEVKPDEMTHGFNAYFKNGNKGLGMDGIKLIKKGVKNEFNGVKNPFSCLNENNISDSNKHKL